MESDGHAGSIYGLRLLAVLVVDAVQPLLAHETQQGRAADRRGARADR